MSQRFSNRTAWDLGESSFAGAIRRAREAGRELIDLTVSNPTVCGFEYGGEALLAPLRDARALTYDPDPRGMRSAREAVAQYYADHGAAVDPDAVLLTTSTSEGYSYLFRLLCDPGDDVLVAQPSYPLFDFLADLDDVRLNAYPLFYDHGWWIDFAELERRIGPRTRVIVIVNPNNPTGHGAKRQEREQLEEICGRHGLALIADEVFLDYPLGSTEITELTSFAIGQHSVPTFVLSGMSKVAGLPQMKVGWIVCSGPSAARRAASERLEMIADTFLSMNAPVQLALPAWLSGRHEIQKQILARVSENITTINTCGIDMLALQAGWSAILRLPRVGLDSDRILERADVIVHPGSFYGMPEEERIVVSLIGRAGDFSIGLKRISRESR